VPTIKSEVQAAASLTVTGLGTLAGSPATYVASATMNHSTNKPIDVLVEVTAATTNTPASNKQLQVFAQASFDGTNFTSGPTSGTSVLDEPDLYPLGVLPMNTATTTHRKTFSLAAAFGGTLPQQSRIIIKNDLGVALTSGSVQTAEVWMVSA
jgi:hypothetical protein